MKKPTLFMAIVALIGAATSIHGETVFLTDGSKLHGSISSSTEKTITLETINGAISIDKSTIEYVNYSSSEALTGSSVKQERAHSYPELPFNIVIGMKEESDQADAAAYFQAGFFRQMADYFATGVSIGYSKFDNKVDVLPPGTITMNPIMLSLRLTTQPNTMYAAYLEGGPAYYMFDHTMTSEFQKELTSADINLEEKLHNTSGYFIGTGLEVNITKSMRFGFTAAHHHARPKVDFSLSSPFLFGGETMNDSEFVDLSFYMVGGSFSWRF